MTRLRPAPKTTRNYVDRLSRNQNEDHHRRRQRGSNKGKMGAFALLLASAYVLVFSNSSHFQRFPEYAFSSPRNLETVDSIFRNFVSAAANHTKKPDAPHSAWHTGRELRPYCEGTTNFFDVEDLELAVSQSLEFHTQGGALKSIQRLLDHNIDATVEKLGAKFVPTGATEGTQQVTKYLKGYYANNFDPRGGYGTPLPGEYEPKEHPLIYGERYVEVADPVGSKERWDFGLGPMGLKCQNLLQLGAKGRDGTKWYCQPKQTVATEAPKLPTSPVGGGVVTGSIPQYDTGDQFGDCHVISIGGNDNWNFERSVVNRMQGCTTHTFDCTLEGGQPKRKPNRERIKFYNYCIDNYRHDDEHGRQYITYFDILEKAGLSAPPVMFKIDVEGFEYDIFSHMIQQANSHGDTTTDPSQPTRIQPSSFWLPQQIMVELHWATRMTGVSWMPRTRTTAEIALLSNMMYSGGGYMPTFQYWHPHCPSCIEVLYFRALC